MIKSYSDLCHGEYYGSNRVKEKEIQIQMQILYSTEWYEIGCNTKKVVAMEECKDEKPN